MKSHLISTRIIFKYNLIPIELKMDSFSVKRHATVFASWPRNARLSHHHFSWKLVLPYCAMSPNNIRIKWDPNGPSFHPDFDPRIDLCRSLSGSRKRHRSTATPNIDCRQFHWVHVVFFLSTMIYGVYIAYFLRACNNYSHRFDDFQWRPISVALGHNTEGK